MHEIAMIEPLPVETLSLVDLQSDHATVHDYLQRSIEKAFCAGGAGILVVNDLPDWFKSTRERLLRAGNALPHLAPEKLSALEFENVSYSIGWSHGKEMFKGKRDFSKGSFYANPKYDDPSLGDADLVAKYPFNMHPNKWPDVTDSKDDKHIANNNTEQMMEQQQQQQQQQDKQKQQHIHEEVKHLEPCFKQIGQMLIDIACLVARHCDALVEERTGRKPVPSLAGMIKESRTSKGRLLHYFPVGSNESTQQNDVSMQDNAGQQDEQQREEEETEKVKTPNRLKADDNTGMDGDSDKTPLWCGFHNDHGTITGLLPAQLFDSNDNMSLSSSSSSTDNNRQITSPGTRDSKAGLYVACDGVNPRRVVIPSDAVAFQIGETAQIVTGGFFRATAHGVRAPRNTRASRVTMAMFMQPNPWASLQMPVTGTTTETEMKEMLKTSPLVPPLAQRFVCGATFDDFTRATLASFY